MKDLIGAFEIVMVSVGVQFNFKGFQIKLGVQFTERNMVAYFSRYLHFLSHAAESVKETIAQMMNRNENTDSWP